MEYSKTSQLDTSLDEVFNFCTSPTGFETIFPYPIIWVNKEQNWGLGSIVEFKFSFLLVTWTSKTEITVFDRQNKILVDVLRGGLPYKYLEHHHEFAAKENGTIYTDRINFSFGYGDFLDRTIGIKLIDSIFNKRHLNMKKYWRDRT
ncbi:MAG: hypothetical protein ACFBSE_22280 [Prochloraceae cyanobacterium]